MEQEQDGQLMRQMRQMQIHESTTSISTFSLPAVAPFRPRSDSGFGSGKEEQMEGDCNEEINLQIHLQVQAAQLPSHLQQQQEPLQRHQQQHQLSNQKPPEQLSSSQHPCHDQHFTNYPQLLKRAQLIPMQNHKLI